MDELLQKSLILRHSWCYPQSDCQNDGRLIIPDWYKHSFCYNRAQLKELRIMAIKFTEEQLNTIDKSLLITMFLGLQE